MQTDSKGRGLLRLVKKNAFQASVFLIVILNIFFFPVIWGNKTLLTSIKGVPSIMPYGAYGGVTEYVRSGRTGDAGASAWVGEPYFKIKQEQYFKERVFPLWNPYNAYGVPFAAQMDSEVYYPLTIIASIYPTFLTHDLYILARLFVAGIFTFLFLRLFVEKVPSLFGAVAYMFTGYFILFLNLPHLSVETLLPAIFYFFERLIRKDDFKNLIGASLIIFLSIIGGMPESTFMTLVFGYMYFIFRFLTDSELRKIKITHIKNFIFMNLLGFGLSAFLLIPFIELMNNSYHVHKISDSASMQGLIHQGGNIGFTLVSLLGYLAPYAMRPAKPIGGGLIGYWGIMPFLFAVLSLIFYIRSKNSENNKTIRFLCIFFSVSAVFLISKRYGLWLSQWIGYLPVFNMIFYVKYQEPLIGFAVAILSGLGFSVLYRDGLKSNHISTALSFVVVVIIITSGIWSKTVMSRFASDAAAVYCVNVIVALIILFFISFLLRRYAVSKNKWMLYLIFAVMVSELFFIFIYPKFYGRKGLRLANESVSPYKGAPYIDYIKKVNNDYYRVFSIDRILYPNWSGAFGLQDVRFLDAMLYDRYQRFVRSFIINESGDAQIIGSNRRGETFDRFTGDEDTEVRYNFNILSKKRFLQLSSVKYMLSASLFGEDIVAEILSQYKGETSNYNSRGSIEKRIFTINNKSKVVFVQHPPSNQVSYKVKISSDKKVLEFIIGLKPEVFKKSDGVDFTLELRHQDGTIKRLFSKYMNPRDNPFDRNWFDAKIDLSEYIGEDIELLFSTMPGPKGDNSWDHAGWGDISFGGSENGFAKRIYDDEIKIYEFPDVLPRAAIFYSATLSDEEEDILTRLKEPSFDIWQKLIIFSKDMKDGERNIIEKVNSLPPKKAEPAKITSYTSQNVEIEADLIRAGILMLNDSNYPGWQVYVDGKKERMLNVNYLFRGVYLESGKHKVEFKYQPRSFYIGLFISSAALLSIIVVLLTQKISTNAKDKHTNH